jgi:hypothetical protein
VRHPNSAFEWLRLPDLQAFLGEHCRDHVDRRAAIGQETLVKAF